MQSRKQLYWNVSYLAICFNLVFVGFSFAQGFITSIFPGSFGFVVLLVLYLAFALSALFAPTLNKFIIRKWFRTPEQAAKFDKVAMMASSLGYLQFLVFVSVKSQPLVILGAVICGCCASELWVSHGMWMSKIIRQFELSSKSEDEFGIVGRANGLFFTVLGLNVIMSGAISICILLFGIPFELLAWIMAVLCALGTCMMFFAAVPQVPSSAAVQSATMSGDIEKPDVQINIWQQDWLNFKDFIKMRNAWLIAPIMFLQGANNGYAFTNMAEFIRYKMQPAGSALTDEAAIMISYYYLVFGVSSIAGSYLWGKVYDIYHSRITPLLLWHAALTLATFGLLIWAILEPALLTALFMILSFLMAQLVYIQNSVIYNCSIQLFAVRFTSFSFSWYRFFFSIAFAVMSLLGSAFNSPNPSEPDWIVCYSFQILCSIVAIVCGLAIERNRAETASHRKDEPVTLDATISEKRNII